MKSTKQTRETLQERADQFAHAPRRDLVPPPAPPQDPGLLPASLTFFLSSRDRAAVLAKLTRRDRDRTIALLKSLGIQTAPRKNHVPKEHQHET